MAGIIDQLRDVLGSKGLIFGSELQSRNNGYLDSSALRAKALLRPYNTAQVSNALQICNAFGQSVVTHGGLTNLVYNTHTTENDIVLSLENMNRVEDIDKIGKTMIVESGATLQKVQESAMAEGLFFPLDISSRGTATIGGNIATNAGGLRVIRYGMMRDHVLGLEVVLADGTILTSMNKMLKNNAGYDLKHLFVGSEGTLGVITKAVLRLWSPPISTVTALLGVMSFEQVINLLNLAQSELGSQISSFEVMWNEFYKLTTTPPAQSKPPMAYDYTYYVIVEMLGTSRTQDKNRFEEFLNKAFSMSLFIDAILPNSSEQHRAIWRVREDTEQIESQYKPSFSFDVSLPIYAMEKYVNDIYDALVSVFGEIKYWVFGHIGDGNLHISLWGKSIHESDRHRVEEIVYKYLKPLSGSISAEHGIGLERKSYLHFSRTYDEISVMRRIKLALDPKGILNPGKVFDLQ
jgi:FAD/FMN-containing dehydrogenase